MCGIFAYLSTYKQRTDEFVLDSFNLGKHRGPESSILKNVNYNLTLGFHRLAINGLNEESNQPFFIDGVYLICNGEIYNYSSLLDKLKITPKTQSDCEVIIYLYKLYGIEYLLDSLDGVFSFILFDSNLNKLYVARDPYGVRPLYISDVSTSEIIIASELKQLISFKGTVSHFEPGSYRVYSFNNMECCSDILSNTKKYSSFGFNNSLQNTLEDYYRSIFNTLYNAVKKRVVGTTQRPVACLLSGGLDSSIITAMVNKLSSNKIETYSIGFDGSVDLKYASIMADYLKTNHKSVISTPETFFDSIPRVIKEIESYDTTTVRASVGNYLIGEYIANNSDAKVIFNGDGSDELTGGYLYMNSAPTALEFDCECRRLLKDIYMYDVLRSDKCISSHGLEPRTPFLDRTFVQMYLSIPPEVRCHKVNNQPEKYLLRKSIEFCAPDILPKEVLWRKKEAFSDGVSSETLPWYSIIKNKITLLNEPGMSDEMKFYFNVFNDTYPNCKHLVPYFWMPRYTNATDPSARTIKEYSD